MKFKFAKVLCACFAIFACGMLGFVGCGEERPTVSIEIGGDDLVVGDTNSLTLVLNEPKEGEKDTSISTVWASVSGSSGAVSTEAEFTSAQPEIVTISGKTLRDGKNYATIHALNPTGEDGVNIIVTAKENDEVKVTINVRVLLPAESATVRSDAVSYGIPLGTPIKISPLDIMNFSPANSSVPEYTYVIGGTSYSSNDVIEINERPVTGYINIHAYPTNDPENEALTGDANVRVYIPPVEDNIYITEYQSTQPIESIELIKNSTVPGANVATLVVRNDDAEDLSVEVVLPDGIGERYLGLNLIKDSDNFTVTGLDALAPTKITVKITVRGINNSVVVYKYINVSVVDYPRQILFNGDSATDPYTLTAYDTYTDAQGTKLTVGIGTVTSYNLLAFSVDRTNPNYEPAAADNILVYIGGGATPMRISQLGEIPGGTTLYFMNGGGRGKVLLNVTAVATLDNDRVERVERQLVVVLEHGISTISVPMNQLDHSGSSAGTLVLELDPHNARIADFSVRELNYEVTPSGASLDAVNITSHNTNIVTVEITNAELGRFRVTAHNTGATQLTFKASTGVTYTLDVEVISLLGAFTINADMNSQSSRIGSVSTKDVELSPGNTVKTIDTVYVISSSYVTLDTVAYPGSSNILRVEYEPGNPNRATVINAGNTHANLQTGDAGDVTITCKVTYLRLNSSGIALETDEYITEFTVSVYVAVTSIELSESNIELLAPKLSGGSVYDTEKASRKLSVKVLPTESSARATNATWTVLSGSNAINMDKNEGDTVTVTALPLQGSYTYITVTIQVTIRDFNQEFSEIVHITIKHIVPISTIYVDGYQESRGVYFELSKQDVYTLETSIEPSNATNPNLEYLVFDAETRPGSTTLEALSRNPADPAYSSPKRSKTIEIRLNEATGKYEIVPLAAGRAIVYIIPQDILDRYVEDINEEISILKEYYSFAIRRLEVFVANGTTEYYRLYDPEDVAAIGNTGGLDKNYYLANTIDMTQYFADNGATWRPIGTQSKPFTGKIVSEGFDNGEGYANGLTPNNIIGWNITVDENLPKVKLSQYYGIFGVIGPTADISYINFYVNNFTVIHNNMELPEYYLGVLAGVSEGNIYHVTLEVAQLNYTYAGLYDSSYITNIGAVGELRTIDTNTSTLGVTLRASIDSHNTSVRFGGIAGKLSGIMGYTHDSENRESYDNSAYVILNLADVRAGSQIGGAVGLVTETGRANNITSDGELKFSNDLSSSGINVNIGGVAGENHGSMYCVTSSQVITAQGNVGGVAGENRGTINYGIYEIFYREESAQGILARGNVGGIVGLERVGGALQYCFAQSYNFSDGNIILNGASNVGGLIGKTESDRLVSINRSFANLNIKSTVQEAVTAGGLVGANHNSGSEASLNIQYAYFRGDITLSQGSAGALVGSNNYAIISDRTYTLATLAVGGGALSQMIGEQAEGSTYTGSNTTVMLIGGSQDITDGANNVKIAGAQAMQANQGKWEGAGFTLYTRTDWGMDSAGGANNGYPYLLRNGEMMLKIVPQSLDFSSKDHPLYDAQGNIYEVQKGTGYSKDGVTRFKNIVILYSPNALYRLVDLFDFITDPAFKNPNDLKVSVSNSSSSVLQILSGSSLGDYRIRIMGTGTAALTVVCSQNSDARDIIQICVVNGFDKFQMTDVDQTYVIKDGDTINIKYGSTTQLTGMYYQDDAEISNIRGGAYFEFSEQNYVQLGKDPLYPVGDKFAGTVEGAAAALLSGINPTPYSIDMAVMPYFAASFYDVDYNTFTLNNTLNLDRVVIDDRALAAPRALRLKVNVYRGATDISGDVGSGTRVYAGEDLVANIVINTDDPDDRANLQLQKQDAYGNWMPASDTEITVNQGIAQFDALTNKMTQKFIFSLTDEYRNNLRADVTFRAILTANSDAGVATEIVWEFMPQKVDFISMAHFSDAINRGNALEQAGELPTNSIIAGEYGLLRIGISPDFAAYDTIELTSSRFGADIVSFDQRAVEYGGAGKGDRYLAYSQGVSLIPDGIALGKITDIYGNFNGTVYVRTLIASSHTTQTYFTLTVKLFKGTGANKTLVGTQELVVRVHNLSVMELGYYNYNSQKGSAYIAVGTGYEGENTPVQNYNKLDVNVDSSYENVTLNVSDINGGDTLKDKVAIVQNGNDYYIKVASDLNSDLIGTQFRVTLSGRVNIDGYYRDVSRELTFTLVDFYIGNISNYIQNVNNGIYSQVYYIDSQFDLRLFGKAEDLDIRNIAAFSYDRNNAVIESRIRDTINRINGIGLGDPYNPWEMLDPVYNYHTSLTWTDDTIGQNRYLIDDNYYLLNNTHQETGAHMGYTLAPVRISSDSVIYANLTYGYTDGNLTLLNAGDSAAVTSWTSGAITLRFYQNTSLDHPIPIYTAAEFTAMEAGKHYILMNDITLGENWTPMNTVISSLNGNGYKIVINGFATLATGTNAVNYGLFGAIQAGTVIKNVTVFVQRLNPVLELGEQLTVNFGLIAGTNAGVINNCVATCANGCTFTLNSARADAALHNVGGLVGVNSGSISNSRVENINLTAYGRVAGLVAENSGTVASCYFKSGTLTNTATKNISNYTATAGLVAFNRSGAKIFGSFTGGMYTITDKDNNIVTDTSRSAIRDGYMISPVNASAFVYENAGTISDSYSSLRITNGTNATGFAFINTVTGTITRCYSTSIMEVVANRSGTPFFGVNSLGQVGNNNAGAAPVNCYYLDIGYPAGSLAYEEAYKLNETQFLNVGGKYNNLWQDYSVSRLNGDRGEEFGGVWVFANQNNMYFNNTRIKTNFGPQLVSAALISTPKMDLDTNNVQVDKETGEVIYSYLNAYPAYFAPNASVSTGYTFDPAVITNAEEFNNYLSFGDQDSALPVLTAARLAADIDLTQLQNQLITLLTSSTVYAGNLEGNTFTISGLDIITDNKTAQDSLGLFAKITSATQSVSGGQINLYGTVKNLNLKVTDLSAALVGTVGALAGTANNANLYNITVDGPNARVTGKNLVGGLVGYVTGHSRINNVTTNVSVTAVYTQTDVNAKYNYYQFDLIRKFGLNLEPYALSSLAYAGGAFGAVDLSSFNEGGVAKSDNLNDSLLHNVTSDGTGSVVGNTAGGVIGVTGADTVISNVFKIVQSTSLIKAYEAAGGLVGENHGIIRNSMTRYIDAVQASVSGAMTGEIVTGANVGLFGTTTVNSLGGLVGINLGLNSNLGQSGLIYNSAALIHVMNNFASNVGGLIGTAMGGDIRACFAIGSLKGKVSANVGGLIGNIYGVVRFDTELAAALAAANITTMPILQVDYVVALNNWSAADYAYFVELSNRGTLGGMVGYLENPSLLTTSHTNSLGGEDPFGLFANEINFFVNQIYNRTVAISTVAPLEGEGVLNIPDVGSVPDSSLGLGKGHTRGYLINNPDIIYAGWDDYSYSGFNPDGTPILNDQIVPDTFYIDSFADLKQMYWHPDKDFVLRADLDLFNTDGEGTRRAFPSSGTINNPFTGEFDGGGHTITNTVIQRTTSHYAGLFGVTQGAYIHDLNIVSLNVSTVSTSSAATYAGGLVGYAIDSTIHNVHISGTVDSPSVITSSATYLGGLVGALESTDLNRPALIDSCSADITINAADAAYSGYVYPSVGGLAGKVSGFRDDNGASAKITSSAVHATVQLTSTYKNSLKYVGGFAGLIQRAEINDCVADADVRVGGLTGDAYAGGFAGMTDMTDIKRAFGAGDLEINIDSYTAERVLYVGGFVGYTNGGSILAGSTATNIIVDGKYLDSASQGEQMLAGYAARVSGTALGDIYSIATLYNYTLISQTDAFSYQGFNGGSDLGRVFSDKNMSLVSRDRGNTKVNTSLLITTTGTGLNTNNYTFSNISYPLIRFQNPTPELNRIYMNIYMQEGSKMSPKKVNNLADYNAAMKSGTENNKYIYYLQTAEITGINMYNPADFWGFYNGDENTLISANYDVYRLNDMYSGAHAMGAFGALVDKGAAATGEFGYGSVVSGVKLDNVNINFDLKDNSYTVNVGLVTPRITQKSIVFGAHSYGFATLGGDVASGNIYVGGVVAQLDGQLMHSSSHVDLSVRSDASGYWYVGGLAARVGTENAYAMRDCYFAGSINNQSTVVYNHATLGGLVSVVSKEGESTASSLHAINCYSIGKVKTVTAARTETSATIAGLNGSYLDNSLYYDSAVQTRDVEIGTAFSTVLQRNSNDSVTVNDSNEILFNALDTSTNAWITSQDANYGYPMLSGEKRLNTGVGTSTDPYLLPHEGHLAWALGNGTAAYYRLDADINYSILKNRSYYNPINTTFLGHLDGNGHAIDGSNAYLVSGIARNAEVSKLKFTNTVANLSSILAANLSGTASEIYVTATTGNVITVLSGGSFKNSETLGAALPAGSTNCRVGNIAGTLTGDAWYYPVTGGNAGVLSKAAAPVLRAFVNTVNDTAKDNHAITGGSFVQNTVTWTIANKQDLLTSIAYIERNQSRKELKYAWQTTENITIDLESSRISAIVRERTVPLMINEGIEHTLSLNNLLVDDMYSNGATGLFGNLTYGTVINNLKLNNVILYSDLPNVGILGGEMQGDFSNIGITNADIHTKGSSVGTLMGTVSGVVSNTGLTNVQIAHSGVEGESYIGGVVGKNGNITGTQANYVNITTTSREAAIGGIIGYSTNSASQSTVSNLTITSAGGTVGGIAAINIGAAATVSNARLNNITLSGGSNTGGVVGNNSGIISSPQVSNANITCTISAAYVGGIVGENTKNVTNAKIEGLVINSSAERTGGVAGNSAQSTQITTLEISGLNITGGRNTGGISGMSAGTINANLVGTNIVNGGEYTGGVAGVSTGTITATVGGTLTVTGTNYTGGISGDNIGNMTVTANGTITINGQNYTGGVVGNNQSAGIINLTTNAGGAFTVSGKSYTGGAVGSNSGTVRGSLVVTGVTGTDESGTIVGQNSGTVEVTVTGNSTLTGNDKVGLVGRNTGGASATVGLTGNIDITAHNNAGVVCGINEGTIVISAFNGTMTVDGNNNLGGVVGVTTTGTISGTLEGTVTVTSVGASAGQIAAVGAELIPAESLINNATITVNPAPPEPEPEPTPGA